jgi:hypothetical protein
VTLLGVLLGLTLTVHELSWFLTGGGVAKVGWCCVQERLCVLSDAGGPLRSSRAAATTPQQAVLQPGPRACCAERPARRVCWASTILRPAATHTQTAVDLARRHDLAIHMDISFPSIPCAGGCSVVVEGMGHVGSS